MKKTKNVFAKSMIIPIVLGLILLILFNNADSKLEQIMIGLIFLMILTPFTLHLVTMLLFHSVPKSNNNRVAENIIGSKNNSNEIKSSNSIKPQYKAKTNNNPLYIETRARLISVVKNGELDRGDILKFKLELDNKLGMNRYAYENFDFENDMHEIYIKLKSSKLNDEDYLYLKGLIEYLVS